MKKIGTNVVLILAWLWVALYLMELVFFLLDFACSRSRIFFDWDFYARAIPVLINVPLTVIATRKKGKYLLLLTVVFLIPYVFDWLYFSKLSYGQRTFDLVHVGEQVNKIEPPYPFCPYIYDNYNK